MKNLTWQRIAIVAGAFVVVSGIALGQGSARDTMQIQGDSRYQDPVQGTMQDTTQRGLQDSMLDQTRNRAGSAIDSAEHGVGGAVNSTLDTVQGSTGKSVEPDNTGINVRDRDDSEMTADEQGQSASDIELTQKIRRAIVDDDSLSTYAKNIKIITKDGMVTLKGPVRSDQEKSSIEAKAAAVAGTGKIKNQIEVKAADTPKNE